MSRKTQAAHALEQRDLDRLSDADLAALREVTQRLATQQQRIVQRYQRQVARMDNDLRRRAARARSSE